MLPELYGARPPGVHAWHGESDPRDTRLDDIDDEDIDIEDDEHDATAAAPAEAAALAEAVARAESAEAELVLLALERREELNIAVARLLLVRAGWPADLLGEELMAEVWRRPTHQHTSDDGRVLAYEDVMAPWRPLLWEAGFFTEHGESDAGESDAGWYMAEDGDFWRSGPGPRLEETVVTLGATGLRIHEVAPRSRAEMVELHTAWTQAARVEVTAGRAAAAAAEAEEEAEAAAEAAAEEEELLLGCI